MYQILCNAISILLGLIVHAATGHYHTCHVQCHCFFSCLHYDSTACLCPRTMLSHRVLCIRKDILTSLGLESMSTILVPSTCYAVLSGLFCYNPISRPPRFAQCMLSEGVKRPAKCHAAPALQYVIRFNAELCVNSCCSRILLLKKTQLV